MTEADTFSYCLDQLPVGLSLLTPSAVSYQNNRQEAPSREGRFFLSDFVLP